MSFRNLIVILFLYPALPVFTQVNCEVPLPPSLNLVSVRPETGMVDVYWDPSPSPGIDAYIIYVYSEENAGWMAADTIWDSSARSYTYITNATKYKSISFVVAAYRLPLESGRPGCPSELSNSIGTVFFKAETDACNANIKLEWNKYQDPQNNVTEYRILVSENNSPLSEEHTVTNEATSFTITDFNFYSNYCFAVKAYMKNGIASGSNKSCVTTEIQKPPQWINTDYISVTGEGAIELSFTIDPEAEITKYAIERSSELISIPDNVSGKVVFTDKKADITKVNYYMLSAVNECGTYVKKTDICSNILLTLGERADEYHLSWNPVKKDDPESHQYEVFVDAGNGFIPLSSVGTGREYIVKHKDLMYDVSAGEVCFIVKAREINNPRHMSDESVSSKACTSSEEVITVPNMFTPNNDMRNDLFKPVLSFTPAEYKLIISDRQGRTLFESNDFHEEWDGSGREQGVYLWFLRVKTPSGKTVSKTGTVTIVK